MGVTETQIHIPTLETERLVLRAPQVSDLDAYSAFCASERSRHVGGPFNRDQSFTRLAALIGHWHLRGFGRWMVTDHASAEPLGVVGVMHPESWPEPEIAWSLFEAAEGRGIAIEAALAARDFAYRVLKLETLISSITDCNTRSVSLAQKLGCRRDGEFVHDLFGKMVIWRHPAASEVVQ